MNGSDESTPITCNPFAVSNRTRYRLLRDRLKSAISDRSELQNGFSYKLDGLKISIAEVGEWISLERQCCPFLCFGLTISRGDETWLLVLTGPEGAKSILEREF